MVPKVNSRSVPADLVDALVSVEGACSSEINSLGQLTGITLHVPSLNQISVLEPVPANPFAVPATAVSSVATFDPSRLAGRRVKVNGSVTTVISGKGFYVQDASGGIRVDCVQTNSLQVGDDGECAGLSRHR